MGISRSYTVEINTTSFFIIEPNRTGYTLLVSGYSHRFDFGTPPFDSGKQFILSLKSGRSDLNFLGCLSILSSGLVACRDVIEVGNLQVNEIREEIRVFGVSLNLLV